MADVFREHPQNRSGRRRVHPHVEIVGPAPQATSASSTNGSAFHASSGPIRAMSAPTYGSSYGYSRSSGTTSHGTIGISKPSTTILSDSTIGVRVFMRIIL